MSRNIVYRLKEVFDMDNKESKLFPFCRVIIAGSRNFTDFYLLNETMTRLLSDVMTDNLEIISGGCRGADKMGELYAKNWNVKYTVFSADWDKYGKAAGPIRNEQMAKYAAEADRGILIAFPIGESRGTRNIIKLAKQYGLEVNVIE